MSNVAAVYGYFIYLLIYFSFFKFTFIMSQYRLAILGDNKKALELNALKANLDFALTWLDGIWQLESPANANYIFVHISSDKTIEILKYFLTKFPIDKLIVASSLDLPFSGIKWLLPFNSLDPCPSVISLVNLLAKVFEEEENFSMNNYENTYRPFDYFLSVIRFAQEDNIPRICRYTEAPAIILSPKEKAYYFNAKYEEILSLLSVKNSFISINKLTDEEFKDEVKVMEFGSRLNSYTQFDQTLQIKDFGINARAKCPIDELIWFSVLASSRGNLLYSYRTTTKIHMLENPASRFNKYFSNEYDILFKYFSSQATSITEVSRLTGRSLFDTINFVNACAVLGKNTILG